MKNLILSFSIMLCCLLPTQVNAQSTLKLTKADKEKIVNKVKQYCDLISTFSKDIEQIDKMEDIFSLCENSKVQTFDDIADFTKQKSGEYHSVPLFQYLQNITTKYENSINITYSDFKCERTVSEPSLGGGLEGNTYAIVHVVKTLKAKGLNKTIPLKITLNTNTLKIGGTVSETYEDPNMLYLKGLEAKDNSDYKKAIEYLKKCFAYKTYPNRYRAMTTLGVIYKIMGKWDESVACLKEAAEHDPVGGITLAGMYTDPTTPAKYKNGFAALALLEKYAGYKDKDYPIYQIMANYMLASLYLQGNMIPKDMIKALEYQSKASNMAIEEHENFAWYLTQILSLGYYAITENYDGAAKTLENMEKNFDLFLNDQLDETKNNIKTLIYQTAGMLYAERQDKVKAYEYLQKLQEMNGPTITLAIANIYKTLKEYDNAIHFYKIGAQAGNADCANIMSLYYMPDTEITYDMDGFDKYLFSPRADKDYGLCFDYTKTGAEKGNINCIARLASMYLVGTKFTTTNLKEALRWTCLYADNCSYTISTPIGMADYALTLCEQQNDTEALGMLEEMEKQGSPSASYFKYFYYNYFKKDSTEAYNSIIKSAEQGYFLALNDICAFTYQANDSVNNYYWCQKMIDRNYSEGYSQMAAYEEKFNHDYKKSIELQKQAFNMENPYAAYSLGMSYKNGDTGLEKDLETAKAYFYKTIEFVKDPNSLYARDADSARIKLREIEEELLSYHPNAPSYLTKMQELTDGSKSPEWRINESKKLLDELFASSKAKVMVVGSNGTTIVNTETAEDYLLYLGTSGKKLVLKEVKTNKDESGKITEIKIQEEKE